MNIGSSLLEQPPVTSSSQPMLQSPLQLAPIQATEQLCNYKFRICNRACIPSFPYCDAHILDDRSMPFIQCQYHGKSGDRRCLNPVFKQSRMRFCDDHACMSGDDVCDSPTSSVSASSGSGALKRRHRSSSYQAHQVSSTPSPGGGRSPSTMTTSTAGTTSLMSEWEKQTPDVGIHVGGTGDDNWSSDGDSADSDDNDPLKRAGVYTQDELVSQAISRWERYVDLCREELGELRRKMSRSYNLYKRDRGSNLGGVGSSSSSSLTGMTAGLGASRRLGESKSELLVHRAQKELKALRRFNIRPGKEYSLQKFGLMYKFGPLETNTWSKGTRSCHYKDNLSTTSNKCSQRALPCSSYCLEHVVRAGDNETDVKDKQHQILIRKCGEDGCLTPVVNWNAAARCPRHTDLASIAGDIPNNLWPAVRASTSTTKIKKESTKAEPQVMGAGATSSPIYTQDNEFFASA